MKRRETVLLSAALLASIAAGFALCARDVVSWDDLSHLQQSRYLLSRFGLFPGPVDVSSAVRWYGPLWELGLGLASEFLFGFLKDPIWVRHACTFAWFPMTLILTPVLLVRGGVRRSTAVLASCFLFGLIRLGGHAAVNVKDAPFACAFLLASVYLWILLREGHESTGGHGYSVADLSWMGFVALIPYLLRPPALIHFPLLLLFLFLYGVLVERKPLWKAAAAPAGLALAALAVVGILFPAIRDEGWRGWLASFAGFSRFPWTAPVRAFGRAIAPAQMSRSYLFIWIPVILHPLVLVGAAAGLTLTAFKPRDLGFPFPLKTPRLELDLSLRLWLESIVALTWGVLLARMPVLYDEERHVLFLYPPLLVLAALGLDPLRERVKYLLCAAIAAGSLAGYAQWGRYSYVYKSPLVLRPGPERFMGDYWGLCVPLAVRALDGLAPAGSEVLIDGPEDVALLEGARLAQSRFARVPGFGPYRFRTDGRFVPPFFAISTNRFGQHLDDVLRDAADGRARILWRSPMPPGEPACAVAQYVKIGR